MPSSGFLCILSLLLCSEALFFVSTLGLQEEHANFLTASQDYHDGAEACAGAITVLSCLTNAGRLGFIFTGCELTSNIHFPHRHHDKIGSELMSSTTTFTITSFRSA